MGTFEKVAALLRSIPAAVAFANQADAAYRASQGKSPEPFTAENEASVAMNLVGLYAADAAALKIALYRSGDASTVDRDDAYIAALYRIAADDLGANACFIVESEANLAWRMANAMRGLARIERPINMPFVHLLAEERAKDALQVRLGAQFILHWLATEQSVAA